jgi:hypothetical protein
MDKSTLNYLRLFNTRSTLSLSDLAAILDGDPISLAEPIRFMMDNKYLDIEPNTKILDGDTLGLHTPLKITYYGKGVLKEELASRKRFKHAEFRAWITFIIAVAAFIKSFFF